MIKKKLLNKILFLFLFSTPLFAQYVPGIKWNQIETEHFVVIFPEELGGDAQILSGKIDALYEKEMGDFIEIKQIPPKWPIILSNRGMIPNAYVSLAPKKSEWYGTPTQSIGGSLEWYDTLALHEMRHMVQYTTLKRRFNSFIYLLSGQSGLSVSLNFNVPGWYFEGDAVFAETIYSDSGRGRDPGFITSMGNIIEQNDYSYQKMVNGSYRDNLTNHYNYGYFMSTYIKEQYGLEAWDKIINKVTLLPIPALGWYWGAASATGKSWTQLNKDLFAYVKNNTVVQKDLIATVEREPLTKTQKRGYLSWDIVSTKEDGSLYAIKYSFNETPTLYQIHPDGKQEKLYRVGSSGSYTSDGKFLVYTYLNQDKLYVSKSYSDLVKIDIASGKKINLTNKTRYLYPTYSADGSKIAVSQWSKEREASIVILDSEEGRVLETLSIPKGNFVTYLTWGKDDKSILYSSRSTRGIQLNQIDLESKNIREIRDFKTEEIKNLSYSNGVLYYTSPYLGRFSLNAMNLSTGESYLVADSSLGIDDLLIKGQNIFFVESFSQTGGVINRQSLGKESWKRLDSIEPIYTYPFKDLVNGNDFQIANLDKESEKGNTEFDIQPYSLAKAKFNVHSWGIGTSTTNPSQLEITLQSTDIFNTLNWKAGIGFDANSKMPGGFLNFTWTQFYPYISWNNSYTYREDESLAHDVISNLSISFPFNLSDDLWQKNLNFSAGINSEFKIAKGGTNYSIDYPINGSLNYSALLPKAKQNLQSRWGFTELFYYTQYPQEDSDRLISTISKFYFPGFAKNDGFNLETSYENRVGSSFDQRFINARGYKENENEVMGDNNGKISINYQFPIAYPDLAFGSLFFIKRLKGNFFYDIQGNYGTSLSTYQSVGAEITQDMTFLNMNYLELSLGFQIYYQIQEKKVGWAFQFFNMAF